MNLTPLDNALRANVGCAYKKMYLAKRKREVLEVEGVQVIEMR